MLMNLLIVALAALALLLIYAATKPSSFSLQRSVLIQAPVDKVFPLVSDLRAFNTWNPFLAQDPAAKLSYEAIDSGKGSAYSWAGEKSGAGRMEITEIMQAPAGSKVLVKLDFMKPMKAQNQVEFSVVPQGDNSQVTWTMSGPANYVHKLMTTFMSMDKMVGGEFEKGLASLKALAEKA
jgi:Polyketide cyclase / dehydrase and lipid transport